MSVILGAWRCAKEDVKPLQPIPHLPSLHSWMDNYYITDTTALVGSEIKSDGGTKITARGVCWGTAVNPTTNDSKTIEDVWLRNISSKITGLSPSTTYYVRAYAINSLGTGYGDQIEFRTEQKPKDLKIKVYEFATKKYLENVEFSIDDRSYGFTNALGEIIIQAKDLADRHEMLGNFPKLTKDHYWTNGEKFGVGGFCQGCYAVLSSFESDTVKEEETMHTVVASLIPDAWIKIHIKNKNEYPITAKASAYLIPMISPKEDLLPNTVFPIGKGSTGNLITGPYVGGFPANRMDTTMLIRTYGNMNNRIKVLLPIYGVGTQSLYDDTRFVNKGDTLKWDVLY